jgi:hypothetical protein
VRGKDKKKEPMRRSSIKYNLKEGRRVRVSVADPHRKNADADPGKNLNADADPDPDADSCSY